jgi:hypothetical protein
MKNDMLSIDFWTEHKMKALVIELEFWVGFTEQGGNNKGQAVEVFQKYVDDKAWGEPWCMSFMQFAVGRVDKLMSIFTTVPTQVSQHLLYPTEHVLTCWNKTPKRLRLSEPKPGAVAIWQHGNSSSGHTGGVVKLEDDGFWTVEGNTGPEDDQIVREGDGVYLRFRPLGSVGNMHLKGFLLPWG